MPIELHLAPCGATRDLKMRLFPAIFLVSLLCGGSAPASAVSTAPLLTLNAYIEGSGHCDERVVEWNRKYNARTIAGEVSRVFYYRVIGFQEWGDCGRPFFKDIFNELQKIWLIFAKGRVSAAEIEAKENELINLMFAALNAGNQGSALIQRYERQTTARLMNLVPERQYFNCTFFGENVQCTD